MSKYKPTRTDDNLPSRSTPIRKGKMSEEQIKKTAEELTRLQVVEAPAIEPVKTFTTPKASTYTIWNTENRSSRKPSYSTWVIEPVPTPWNYKVFAEGLKAMIIKNDTIEIKAEDLAKAFPQARRAGDVARNLKQSYGISYRRVENWRNDTYVFFIEPTKEELMKDYQERYTRWWNDLEKLGEENKDLKKKLQTMQSANNQTYTALSKLEQLHIRVKEENTQLKSDLNNSQKTNKILFWFAIWAVITILIKSVAL